MSIVAVQQGEGTSAGSSGQVQTGAGGTGFPSNVTGGNDLIVALANYNSIFAAGTVTFAQSGSAPLGTPVQLYHLNDITTNDFEIFIYRIPITGNGSCILTGQFSQANLPMAIQAVECSGIGTFTGGQAAGSGLINGNGTTTIILSSGNITPTAGGAVIGFGYNYQGRFGSPYAHLAPATGYTGTAPVWTAITGTAEGCMTFEVQNFVGTTPIDAEFNPTDTTSNYFYISGVLFGYAGGSSNTAPIYWVV